MTGGGGYGYRMAAVIVFAFNLRLATSAVAPLLPIIREDTGISASAGGLLLTLPFLCFGTVAPVVTRVARRLGTERTLVVALAVLVASIVLRSAPGGLGPLFGGTLLMGAAITFGNILLPGIIKREFPNRAGVMLGIFTTAITAGAGLAAAVTVPLMLAAGWGWQQALAFWAASAAVAFVLWVPLGGNPPSRGQSHTQHVGPSARLLYRDSVAWQVTLFFGLQSLVYTAAVSWIPSVLTAHGISVSNAGFLLAIVSVTGMVTTFTVPVAAMQRRSQGTLVVAAVALLAISLAGLLVAPAAGAVLWMLLFGLGQGATYGLGFSLILLRSIDPGHAVALSGMTQTFGYLLSAVGPIGLGVLHDATGGWSWPLIVLLVLLAPLTIAGLGGARRGYMLGGLPTDPVPISTLTELVPDIRAEDPRLSGT